MVQDNGVVRKFDTGADRSSGEGKLDFEACLSPQVLAAFARYMLKHCKRADGTMRECDNWQKGMPLEAYLKSLLRHVWDLWLVHRGLRPECDKITDKDELLGAILFNVQGYWFETMRKRAEADDCGCMEPFPVCSCGHQPPPAMIPAEDQP